MLQGGGRGEHTQAHKSDAGTGDNGKYLLFSEARKVGAKGPNAHFKLGAWPLLLIPQQIPNAVHIHLYPCQGPCQAWGHGGAWGDGVHVTQDTQFEKVGGDGRG